MSQFATCSNASSAQYRLNRQRRSGRSGCGRALLFCRYGSRDCKRTPTAQVTAEAQAVSAPSYRLKMGLLYHDKKPVNTLILWDIDAPFADVIEELQITGDFVNNSFHARFHPDRKPVKTCTSYFKLQQALVRWMRQNPQGGLVVFLTSDNEFLREITTVHEAAGFTAKLLYVKEDLPAGPGMREKVVYHCEWITWLREQMQRPLLQLQPFSDADWESPHPEQGWGQGQIGIESGNNQYEQHSTLSPGSSPGSAGDSAAHDSRQGLGIQSAGLGESNLPAITNMRLTDPESSVFPGTLAPTVVISQPGAAFGTAGQSVSGATEQSTFSAFGRSSSATSLSGPTVPVTADLLPTQAAAVQPEAAQEDAVIAAMAAAKQTPAFASSVAAKMAGFHAGKSTPSLISTLQEVMDTLLPNVSYSVASLHNYGSPVAVLMFPDMITAQWAKLQINGKQHGTMQLSLRLVPEKAVS